MRPAPTLAAALLVACLAATAAAASAKLRVGVVTSLEPFVFDDPIAGITGFDIDLVAALMTEMGRPWELVVADNIEVLLADLETTGGHNASIDLAISALTVTLPRQKAFDFSQPYMDSGLSVLVSSATSSKTAIYDTLFSPLFLLLIFVFVLGLLVFGHCLWALERNTNSGFSGEYAKGVFDGVWWASVTATTVGYGDISPRSRLGKLSAILIMFWGLIVTSFFVGTVSSALTLSVLAQSINGVNDLAGRTVGVVSGQSSAEYARSHIPADLVGFPTLEAAGAALLDGRVEAVVDDTPLLLYYAAQKSYGRAKVVGDVFDPQRYALGFPFASAIAEDVNVALAKLEVEGAVASIYTHWFTPRHGETGGDAGSDQVHVSKSLSTGFGVTMGVVLTLTLAACAGTYLYGRAREESHRARLPDDDALGVALVSHSEAGTELVPPDASMAALSADIAELKALVGLLLRNADGHAADSDGDFDDDADRFKVA